MVPGKKNILSGGRHLLSGGRHLIKGSYMKSDLFDTVV